MAQDKINLLRNSISSYSDNIRALGIRGNPIPKCRVTIAHKSKEEVKY